jgi:hypothetical protein
MSSEHVFVSLAFLSILELHDFCSVPMKENCDMYLNIDQ